MSVIESATSAEQLTATNNSSKTDSSESPSTAFRDLIDQITQRQKKLTSILDTFSQENIQRQQTLATITQRLQRYFLPEENLSQKLLFSSQWFSASNGTQSEFLDSMNYLSQENPRVAANTSRNLFSFLDAFKSAFANTSSGSEMMSSSITSFTLNASIFQSGISANRSLESMRALSMEFKMEQVEKHSVESVEETQLLENGGSMIEVEGKYINISVYMKLMDPIVLDLAGDGINLKSVSDGVMFDLAGNGQQVRCGFVQNDDALLFMDSDGDGVCSNGLELFGDQQGHANGFAELSEYDLNSDGEIDDNDSVYSKLKVWNDINGDGISQREEVRDLRDAGVEALSLGHCETHEENNGNIISQKSFFRRFSGELGVIADANFVYCDK